MNNNDFDYFNLISTRISPNNKMHEYIRTDLDCKRLSTSTNNKRSISHKDNININSIENEINYIKPYGEKNRANYIFNYFQNNNKNSKRNLNNMSSSSSNFQTIQDKMELKQRDLLIDKLNKELYKKNHQLYKKNNLISDLQTKIKNKRNSEKINISNNIFPNNKMNQINNTIYNLKKSSINNELTSKLKENEDFYKKIINENLDSFNYKLIELENKNIILIKKNQSLKNELSELKNKFNIIQNKKFLSIKPTHEINLYFIKNNNFIRIDKNNKNEILKMQKLISQYKLANQNLNNEINLLKTDIQMKNNQILNIKNQYNNKQKRINEILIENKSKEKNITIKEKELENKKNEVNNLNNKLKQLLNSFEIEKKEKEEIQKLYEKNNTEIEKIKSLSNDSKLKNISSISHKILLTKNCPKYKLSWFLITIKNENEIKNYLNTFWISEEEMKKIQSKLSPDNYIMKSDEENSNNNEMIRKLNDIVEEKDKIINQLKIKINEKEILNNNLINNNSLNSDDNNKDKKGFVSMDKYIKIVNQLSEAKMKINELASENKDNKNKNLNQEIKNFNESVISEEFSDFFKNVENGKENNNKINLNNSDDNNKYLEKYIDDLENKIEKIKNLIKLLIQEMEYTSNINNILYNLMIISGYDDQQAISLIQEKKQRAQKKLKTNK